MAGVQRWAWSVLLALVVALVPLRARAFDLSGGVAVGGITAGAVPYLAISPHVATAWPLGGDFYFMAQGMVSVLPAVKRSWGVYSPFSLDLAYKWGSRTFSLGPSFAFFYLPACGVKYCARTTGLAPGIHARVEVYFIGPLGVAVNGNVDWIIGNNSVLAGEVAGMAAIGPVIRWEREVIR